MRSPTHFPSVLLRPGGREALPSAAVPQTFPPPSLLPPAHPMPNPTRPAALPPVTGAGAAMPARFAGLFAIELKRLLRGWRWRGLLGLSLIAAWWFSRGEMFGEGAIVYFPGGPRLVVAAFSVWSAAAVLLGAEVWGGVERARAHRLVETRLRRPVEYLAAGWLAVVLALVPVMAAATMWPSIGYWRADLPVYWTPPLLALLVVGLPLAMMGAAAGVLGRILGRTDFAGIAAGLALAAGPAWVRLVFSEPIDIFIRSDQGIGSLVATPVLVQDALQCAAIAFAYLGVAILLLPRQRIATPPTGAVPTLSIALAWALARVRITSRGTLAVALLLLAAGAPAVWSTLQARAFPVAVLDFTRMAEPPGTVRGVLPAARIIAREITFGATPETPLEIRLLIAAGGADPQPSAALSFGLAHRVAEARAESGAVEVFPIDEAGETAITVLRFDPPLDAEARAVVLRLAPRPEALRRWSRGWHHRFRSFDGVGPWWGVAVAMDYAAGELRVSDSPSPYLLRLPEPGGDLVWVSRTAEATRSGEQVTLTERRPDLPASLVAAPLVRVPGREGSFPIEWRVFARHERLAREFPAIYAESLRRLRRVFGGGFPPIPLYEVPGQGSGDPLAMPSSVLEELSAALPFFSDVDNSSAPLFDERQKTWHRGIVERVVSRAWLRFEDDTLLRTSMIEYLHNYALNEGNTRRLLEETKVDTAFAPWSRVRQRFARPIRLPESPGDDFGRRGRRGPGGPGGRAMSRPEVQMAKGEGYPFDLRPAQREAFRGPVDPARRPPDAPPVPEQRAVAFHHMLRGMLGEDAFAALVRDLFATERNETLTLARYREAAERAHGADLAWFFEQWLETGAVPRYRIRELRAALVENVETRSLEYRTRITISNDGDGRMPVPWVLETEGDTVEGREWLGAGEVRTLELRTLGRPIAFAIDPEGWIVQEPEFDTATGQPTHPRAFVKAIAEM